MVDVEGKPNDVVADIYHSILTSLHDATLRAFVGDHVEPATREVQRALGLLVRPRLARLGVPVAKQEECEGNLHHRRLTAPGFRGKGFGSTP